MFAKEVYINRRNTLKTKIGSGILLFLGTGEAAVNYAGNAYRYRQDSTFNYYFGLTDPDLAAVIDLESGEEIVFGNDVDIDDIIWMGPQPQVSDKAASVGVSKSLPFGELEKYLSKAKAGGRKVHFLPPYRYQNMIRLNRMLGVPFDRMRDDAHEAHQGAVRDRGDRQGLQHRLRHALYGHEDGPSWYGGAAAGGCYGGYSHRRGADAVVPDYSLSAR